MSQPARAARRATAAAALTCLAGLISACGGGTPAPARTVTVSASAAAAPAATATPAGTSPASPAAPAAPAPCATGDLRLTLGLAQGAAGSIYQVIDFTNAGPATCSLYGYPGVSLLGGTPARQIGLAAWEDPTTPRQLVTLAPGAVANAVLRVVQAGLYPSAACVPVGSRYLRIYPPNQTVPVSLGYRAQACSRPLRQLSITVVTPGSGG